MKGFRFTKGRFNAVMQDYMILYAVVVLVVILSLASDVFMSGPNMLNVLRQISMTSILAVGAFFILVGGGIDISLGSVVGLCGVGFAFFMAKLEINPLIAFFLTLVVGAACGAVNGVLVSWCGIPPFIATLGMMSAARGLTYVITDAIPIIGLPESVKWLGRGYFWGIPWPVIIMAFIFIIAAFVAKRTKFGRFCYTIGGNETSAYLSGINVPIIRVSTYLIGGVLSAVSGCILTSRLNSGQPAGGIGWEFDAITAAVLGGVSINGGKGKVLGVFLGAVFIGFLMNGMSLLEISSYVQDIIKGVVLVLAIGIDVVRAKLGNR